MKRKTIKGMYWFDTGIFPATVMFIFGYTYDEVISYCKKKKGDTWAVALSDDRKLFEESNYCAFSRTIENNKTGDLKYHYIIKIKERFKFTDYEYAKLAHEVLHICQFMLPGILNRDRETEAEAYLHTYLMRKCLAALRG